mmetsp:Transcript_49814/g.107885  ORF Transcript_49814/g.107885 Transcript_49814/m.107885 type:complete len:575 (-) Transcript_49814:75-1799(-)
MTLHPPAPAPPADQGRTRSRHTLSRFTFRISSLRENSDGFDEEHEPDLIDSIGIGSHLSYLFRCGGSALPRAVLPSLLSAGLAIIYQELIPEEWLSDLLIHPYPYQVFAYVAAFALVFRTNISYQRFWESRTQCALMSSKWADAALECLTFDQVQKRQQPRPVDDNGHAIPLTDAEIEKRADTIRQRRLFQATIVHRFSLLHAIAIQVLRRDKTLTNLQPALGRNNTVASRFSEVRARKTEVHQARKKANMHPPLRVLGGLSARQASRLEPVYDRVGALLTLILETISQRRVDGGLAGVEAPGLSRVYQVLSEGTNGFAQARKITHNPFPFAYSQVVTASLYILLITFPLIADAKIGRDNDTKWFAPVLSFITAIFYLGLHEVSIELEEPFRPPGDFPLVILQDDFNERLLGSLHTLGSQELSIGQVEAENVVSNHWPSAPLEAISGGSHHTHNRRPNCSNKPSFVRRGSNLTASLRADSRLANGFAGAHGSGSAWATAARQVAAGHIEAAAQASLMPSRDVSLPASVHNGSSFRRGSVPATANGTPPAADCDIALHSQDSGDTVSEADKLSIA